MPMNFKKILCLQSFMYKGSMDKANGGGKIECGGRVGQVGESNGVEVGTPVIEQ